VRERQAAGHRKGYMHVNIFVHTYFTTCTVHVLGLQLDFMILQVFSIL